VKEWDVSLGLLVATGDTREDVEAALERSGIALGNLIGEALIMDIDIWEPIFDEEVDALKDL